MEKIMVEKTCFIFKNNKEADFYFKNIKMKCRKGCIIDNEARVILVPYTGCNLLEKILIKLGLLASEYAYYEFLSERTASNLDECYNEYWLLDKAVDYMPQLKEIMLA